MLVPAHKHIVPGQGGLGFLKTLKKPSWAEALAKKKLVELQNSDFGVGLCINDVKSKTTDLPRKSNKPEACT